MGARNSRSGVNGGLILLFAAALGIWVVMGLLGHFFATTFQEAMIKDEGISGELLIEGFLAPHARKLLEGSELPEESNVELMAALELPPVAGKIIVFKLWDMQGNLVFTSNGTISNAEHFPSDEIEHSGTDPVVEMHAEGIADENLMDDRPVIEIYAPIFDASREKIIAIGEIYGNAADLSALLDRTTMTIWLAVSMTAVGLTGCLFLLAARQRDLVRNLAVVQAQAAQNRDLKDYADQARLQASQANEDLLNRLGAELHDGPLQMLTLLSLVQGSGKEVELEGRGLTARDLIARTMTDLRTISAGLVLPEIAELPLAGALRLAVTRHEEIVGSQVALHLDNLPETVDPALKICCYRLVQEGLNNAARHGDPTHAEVRAAVRDGWIEVTISNPGGKASPPHPDTGRSGGLGLQGLRLRISVFGGSIKLTRREDGGADLQARIPLEIGSV